MRNLRILVVVMLALVVGASISAAGTLYSKSETVVASVSGGPYGYAAGDSLAAQAADTSGTFQIKGVKDLSLWIQANADTTALTVQLSQDGTVWETYVNAAAVIGTTGTNCVIYHKNIDLTSATGTFYSMFPGVIKMRVIVKCNDVASRAASDGVKSLKYYLLGYYP